MILDQVLDWCEYWNLSVLFSALDTDLVCLFLHIYLFSFSCRMAFPQKFTSDSLLMPFPFLCKWDPCKPGNNDLLSNKCFELQQKKVETTENIGCCVWISIALLRIQVFWFLSKKTQGKKERFSSVKTRTGSSNTFCTRPGLLSWNSSSFFIAM